MPSFRNTLSEDQVHSLVTHIRSLGGKRWSGLGTLCYYSTNNRVVLSELSRLSRR
jgi:hypothetical protein